MLKPHPLPKSIKQREIIFFIFLFLAVALFAIPQGASAAWWSAKDWGNAIVNGLASLFLVYLFWLPLLLVVIFGTITNVLLKGAIVFATIGTSYTNSYAVQVGWPIVRDLANMVVVLGFVIIGIATILRFKDYEAKKLLPSLIIAALLINFSLVITGIFIDASNTFMTFFFGKVDTISSWFPAISDLSTLYSNIAENNILDFAPKLIGMIFFYLIAALVNLLYFFLILGRVLALWMLVILSPLAFVCYVFPATKPIWQMWWKNFFQWCIIIIPAGLFYYIGAKMVSDSASKPGGSIGELIGSGDWVVWVSNAISVILVPALFLIIGFLVSLQFSAMGANVILGAANKYKGTVAKGTLGSLAKMSGKSSGIAGRQLRALSNKWQGSGNVIGRGAGWAVGKVAGGAEAVENYRATSAKTRSAFGRGLEWAGAIPEGATDMKEAARLEEEAKRMKFVYSRAKATGDTNTVERLRGEARAASEERGGIKSGAAMKVVTEAGDLHDVFKDKISGKIDLSQAQNALNYAAQVGAENIKKEAVKTLPELERKNAPVVDKILTQHPGWSQDQAEHEAVVRATRRVAPDKLDRDLIESTDHRVLRDAGDRMTRKQKEELKNNLPDIVEELKTIRPGTPTYNAARFNELADKWSAVDGIKM